MKDTNLLLALLMFISIATYLNMKAAFTKADKLLDKQILCFFLSILFLFKINLGKRISLRAGLPYVPPDNFFASIKTLN